MRLYVLTLDPTPQELVAGELVIVFPVLVSNEISGRHDMSSQLARQALRKHGHGEEEIP